MGSRALIAIALLSGAVAGTVTGCATAEMKSACSQSFSWAGPAFHCGGASGGTTPEVAVKPPAPESEPGAGPTTSPGTGPTEKPAKPAPVPEPTPPPEPAPTAKVAAGRIDMSDTVAFEADSAVLTDRSKQLLDDVARELSDHPEFKRVVIEDYTELGKRHNMKLSQERAAAVKSYLAGKGVAAKRLTVKAFGDTKGKGKNPRVEFRVFKK
jgi:outer membrane protein OmpA-like peptidoglycan-associated protein